MTLTDETRTHDLKVWPEHFRALDSGVKTFEVRLNDRGFKVGDSLLLREWDFDIEKFTGRTLVRTVPYILHGPVFGLERGYVCMSLSECVAEEG